MVEGKGADEGAHKDYFSAVFTILEQCKKFTNNRQRPWGKSPLKWKGSTVSHQSILERVAPRSVNRFLKGLQEMGVK